MTMSSVFKYCTRCGEELTHEEAERCKDDLPPICDDCLDDIGETLTSVFHELRDMLPLEDMELGETDG